MTAAALGTTLTLPTLEADVERRRPAPGVETEFELEIRPGTQSGTEQVLRGRGVPGLRGGRGDLVVTIVVETPTRLDPRQEELLARAGRDPRRGAADRPGAARQQVGLRPAPRRVQPRTDVPDEPAGPPGPVAGRGRRSASTVERRRATRRTTPSPYAGCGSGSRSCSPTAAGRRSPATVASTGKRVFEVDGRRRCRRRPRARAGGRRRAGDPQGRPRRARRRGADRDRRRRDRAVGGRAERRGLEGRAGREVPVPLAIHRPRGRQAGPPVVVPRGRRAGVDRRRRRRWSAAADLAVVLHEEASAPLASLDRAGARARSSSWSVPRAA